MEKPVTLNESKSLPEKIWMMFISLLYDFYWVFWFPNWLIKGMTEKTDMLFSILGHIEWNYSHLANKMLTVDVIFRLSEFDFQWSDIGPDHSVNRELYWRK